VRLCRAGTGDGDGVGCAQAGVPPARAETAQGEVSLTIYNNDLALVEDVRDLQLPAGRARQEFADVSAQIRPETVTLAGPGFGVVEQNFDYDLLSRSVWWTRAWGRGERDPHQPATGAETVEHGTILANNEGTCCASATGSRCWGR
jgi:hypothetical protein